LAAREGWPEASRDAFSRLARLTNQQPEATFQQTLLARMSDKGVLYEAEYVQARGKHRGPRSRYYLNGQVVLFLADSARLGPVHKGRCPILRQSDLSTLWDDLPVTGIADEGGVRLRRGKKPERLLRRVIESFSLPGDWVIDPFAGSGPPPPSRISSGDASSPSSSQPSSWRWPRRDFCEPLPDAFGW